MKKHPSPSPVQQYLDGELPLEALSAADREQAEQWSSLLEATAALRHVSAPVWLEARTMASLPARPNERGLRRVLAWLTDPQPIRVRPISLAALGAVGAIALFMAWPRMEKVVPTAGPSVTAAVSTANSQPAAIVYVQFVFASKTARTVTVAGDFNGWDVVATPLMDTDGDGVWTGRVALRPGLHKYMFVVNGEEWVTDPQADTYVDDGFGMRNAIVTVAQPNGRAI
jgi:hypothetical protein